MILLWAGVIFIGVPLSDSYKPWGAWIAWAAGLALLYWLLRFRATAPYRNSKRTAD